MASDLAPMADPDDKTSDDEMMAGRQALWEGFLRWSTYSIVAVALVLLIMAGTLL